MITRRYVPLGVASVWFLAQCTGGTIDPTKVLADLKTVCGIAVPLATIAAIISASVGATAQSIVDLLCSGFHQAQVAQAAQGLKATDTIEYDVVVGGKTIHVIATKQ